jgi:hypothetical protein
MAPSITSRCCRCCPPVTLVALAFFVLASSSSALIWGASIFIIFSCLFGEKILNSAPFLLSGNYIPL